jgi:hypothetical protein
LDIFDMLGIEIFDEGMLDVEEFDDEILDDCEEL